MLTPHTHVTPINITGIAEANAQDQAEADQLLGTARGIIAEMEQVGQESIGNPLFSPTVLPDAPTADPYRRKLDLWAGYDPLRQRELDRAWDATGYPELGIDFDREGKWHGDPLPVARGAWNGTLLVLAVCAALALIALAVKYGPAIWR